MAETLAAFTVEPLTYLMCAKSVCLSYPFPVARSTVAFESSGFRYVHPHLAPPHPLMGNLRGSHT